jgi:hypothetical protein
VVIVVVPGWPGVRTGGGGVVVVLSVVVVLVGGGGGAITQPPSEPTPARSAAPKARRAFNPVIALSLILMLIS